MLMLSSEMEGKNGPYVNRISWTPNEDGTVRQHWETRTGDADWTTLFDGLYTRKAD